MPRPGTKKEAIPKDRRGLNDRKPRAERWEELLEAAATIFYEKGYDATSLQEISAKVGILKGSIYYYIDTKSDLRDAVLTQVHLEGLAVIKRLAQTEGDALDKLEAMIRGHIDYACRNLIKVTVYLQELKMLSPKERSTLFKEQGYRDVFLDVIAEGQRAGTILPKLDSKLAAQAMLGSLNSVYRWYSASAGRPISAIADHFVATLLRGHATAEALQNHTNAPLAGDL